jgi:thermitase
VPPKQVQNLSHLEKNENVGYYKNWGISNTKVEHSDINVKEACKLEKGNKSIVVAIIDTGIDSTHVDLAKNLWVDPVILKETNMVVYGWNFVNDSPNPLDDHGHGTHIAGIIGSVQDLKTGMAGVSPDVTLMPIKYYSESNPGFVNLRNTVNAINYAVDHGAKIINYSGGGPEFSQDEYLAIKRAESKGILFVAAAGNEHQNTDLSENYYYPAAYRLSNIISVASTDINNKILPSSNWGQTHVDVAAPGENIYSTLPGGRFGYMTGTSQATAFVSGIAALLLAHDPKLTPQEIKDIIMRSVDPVPELKELIVSGGKVNAYSSLKLDEELKKSRQSGSAVSYLNQDKESNNIQNLFSGAGYSSF